MRDRPPPRPRGAWLATGLALAAIGCQGADPAGRAAAEAAAPGPPAIACDAPEHRFGRVWQGARVRHTFRVENAGQATLRLERLRAACACTSAGLDAAELAPGAGTGVEVELDTRGLLGPIERVVEVLSGDPDRSSLPLRLVGEVQLAVAFAEERLDLGSLLPGEAGRATLGLRGELAARARLRDLQLSGAEGWSARVVEREGEDAVELELAPGRAPGRREARLVARTGLAEAPEIHLALDAEVAGDLRPDRPAVSFDPFDAGSPPRTEIAVRSTRGAAFRVTGLEDPAGVVRATLGPRPPRAGAPQPITLELTRSPSTPRGRLRIHTDRADQPTLEVPYVVRPFRRPAPPPPPPRTRARRAPR